MIRETLGLSRKDVELLSGGDIKSASLSTFENNQSQISISYLRKLVSFYEEKGVDVSYDWIITGNGISPREKGLIANSLSAIEEMDLFKKKTANSIILTIETNEFRPLLTPGDVVGGIRETSLQGLNLCIIRKHTEYVLKLAQQFDAGLIVTTINSPELSIIYQNDISSVYRVVFIRSN
jgi:hypothetical protein